MRWNQVMTFSDLQYWLEERDVSVSRIAKDAETKEWEVDVECNHSTTPLMSALGRTEKDFDDEPESCGLSAVGVDVFEAIRCVMHDTDDALDELKAKDRSQFGPIALHLEVLREQVAAGTIPPADVARMMRGIADHVRKDKGAALGEIPALNRFLERDYRSVLKDMLPRAKGEFLDAVVAELEKGESPLSP